MINAFIGSYALLADKTFGGYSGSSDLTDFFGELKFSSLEKLKTFVALLVDKLEFGVDKTKYGQYRPYSDYAHTQGEVFWAPLTYYISVPEFADSEFVHNSLLEYYVVFSLSDGYGDTNNFAYFYYTFSGDEDSYSMSEIDSKLKVITDNNYIKTEIDLKLKAITDRLTVLETKLSTSSTVTSTTTIDSTQFSSFIEQLKTMSKLMLGVK